jgi:acetate---CoA ligase (ADP-forming)
LIDNPVNLDALFKPRSIAVIGASADRRKNSGRPINFLKEHGYEGAVYPVNPKYEELLGWRCYPSISAVQDPVDLALIALPADQVLGAVDECGRMGVRNAIVISSGFGEIGPEGKQLEQDLLAIARRHGMRLCGPNSVGIINTRNHLVATFSQAVDGRNLTAGSLALISQSGNFGTFMIELALRRGIGVSHFISTGNESDLTFLDYLSYLVEDPDARVIAGYVEGLRDGTRLRSLGQAARAAGKYVVMLKVGRTGSGSRSAMSHTGAMVGDDKVYDTALKQAGILRVEHEEELLDVLPLLLGKEKPAGRRVGIVSVSGGGATMMTDACEAEGLEVPILTSASQQALQRFIPPYGAIANPIDLTGQVLGMKGGIGECLRIVYSDPAVDVVILFLGLMERLGIQVAEEILQVRADQTKPLVVSWVAGPSDPIAYLRREGVCVTTSPGIAAAKAAANLVRVVEWGSDRVKATSSAPLSTARVDVGMHGVLSGAEARDFLERLGIRVPARHVVTDSAAAVRAAELIGYPVALKLERPIIAHKTEAKAIRLNLLDAASVREAADSLMAIGRSYVSNGNTELLVETMAPAGTEFLLGMQRDPQFGAILSFGLGGVQTELFADVVTRVLPLNRGELASMCRMIRNQAVLDGFRGQPAPDLDAIISALVALASVDERYPDVSLIEINPFIVGRVGQGGVAVDALIQRGGQWKRDQN